MTHPTKPVILVVDDRNDAHWLYERILGEHYKVLSVYRYPDLLELLRDSLRPSIALAITDFDLDDTEHDGLDVARLLWQKLSGVPTLMMSGFDPSEKVRIQEFLSDERANFLSKDVAANELEENVSKLIQDAQDARWNHDLKNRIANVSMLEKLLERTRDEEARAKIQERLEAARERLVLFRTARGRK